MKKISGAQVVHKNIIKKIFILLFFLFLLFLFSRDFSYEIEQIVKKGYLDIAMYKGELIPFFMDDKKGNIIGEDVKIAEKIAKALGVTLRFKKTAESFDAVVDMVAKGEADIGISHLSATLDRAKKVNFTKPYLLLNQGLLVNRFQFSKLKKKGTILEKLNDNSVRIAFLENSAFFSFEQNLFPNAQKMSFPTREKIYQAIKKGKVVAAIVDEVLLKTFSIIHPEDVLLIESVIIKDKHDYIAIAIPLKWTHFLNWMNMFLDRQVGEIDVDDVLKDYYSFLKKTKNVEKIKQAKE